MSELKAPEIALERRRSFKEPFETISSKDLFGKSYVLLAASDGQAWCESAETVRGKLAGVSFDVHRVGSKELRDPEGRFGPEYRVGSTGAVLVRPDGYVAWRAETLDGDPESALTEAFSQIVGKKPPSSANGPTPVQSAKPVVVSMKAPAAAEAAPKAEIAHAVARAPAPAAAPDPVPIHQRATGGFHNPFAMPVPSLAGVKLYVHPISMFSRPIRLFVAESGLNVQEEIVDLAKGAHHDPGYANKNPSQLVPMLEEGDFRLTESAAILKYLAEKANSPAYPSDPARRAKIDEMMDWLNTQFYRDWGHNLCLPQLFPHHRRRSDEAHAGAIEWGQQNSRRWLRVLNDHWVGGKPYLVGDRITIADYFGAALVTLGEVIHTDFSPYPNVERWLNNMKRLKHWAAVNKAFNDFAASTRNEPFKTV